MTRKMLLPAIRQQLSVAALLLIVLTSILWAGTAVWTSSCQKSLVLFFGNACPWPLADLEPVLIGLGFWVAALVIWILGRPRLTSEFFFLCAGLMVLGQLSSMGDDLASRLFYVLLCWIAPIGLDFHLSLLGLPLKRDGRVALTAEYTLAILLSLPALFWTRDIVEQSRWFALLKLIIRLNLLVSLILTAWLLLKNYRHQESGAVRRHVRLTTFGTILGSLPLLLLSALPDAFGRTEIPFEFTFPFLLLSPLAYGYSILSQRMVRAERLFGRMAFLYVLATLLLSIYLVSIKGLPYITSDLGRDWPLLTGSLGVALLLFFSPLQRVLQMLVTWVIHGDQTSYVQMVERLSESLSRALDRETLRSLLIDELKSALGLSKIVLFIRDQNKTLLVLGTTGLASGELAGCQISGDKQLASYLEAKVTPLQKQQVRAELAEATLSADERRLLDLEGISFWLPLVCAQELQGLVLIGQAAGEYPFLVGDERILTTLMHQAGIAALNTRLVEQVSAGRQELARAHQQLLVGHEQELRRLAQELHDSAVQQLLGISYQLGALQAKNDNGASAELAESNQPMAEPHAVRQEVLGVVGELRDLISKLRPAGLDELGLTDALEGYIADVVREGGSKIPEIVLDINRRDMVVSGPVAICLFRVAQESLRNALNHAQADCIQVRLHYNANQIQLNVCDDGRGFSVPARLSEFARSNHFGLIGMAERVAWAGGQFHIQSQPGVGTEISIRVPVTQRQP